MAARLYRLQIEALETASVPVSLRQFRILNRIDSGTSSMTALSNLASRRLSTISKSVDSLVRQGLLTREQVSSDRRTVKLALTPMGAAVLREIKKTIEGLTAWLVEDIEGDHDALLAAVQALYERAASRLRTDVDKTNGAPAAR